jgi:oxygen-independent coproporphyrinogen-3 oxidase
MAGIYVHIPFCKTLCSYCDFYRVVVSDAKTDCINAIVKEISLKKDYLEEENISTIYIGGGTPSILSINETEAIINQIYKHFSVDEACEITIEANPDDIDIEYLSGLRKLNVNRISLGIQSWQDADLKLMNRRHDSKQAEQALKNVIKAGFENISVDLIYGLPKTTIKDWESNLDTTFSYDIQHLSAYHLTIEQGTRFQKMLEKGIFNEIDEEESAALFNILIEKSDKAGFLHYEISNFGKPGYFSIHNSNYWKQVNYIGVGPSAHSFNGYSRQWNIKAIKQYINLVNAGKTLFEKEELDAQTKFNEYIMTSLRTMWGIDLNYVEKTFEKEGYDYIVNLSGKFKEYGLMKSENQFLILTNQGKMISDNIIAEFMMTTG